MMKRILPVLLSILMFFSSINSAYAFENNSNSPIASDHSREAEDLATLLFEEDWTIYDETGKDITAEFYTVANDLYRQHAYESIMEAFVGMTAHAIKREIVPSEDRSISWIYEEEVGYEYVDELNHNFPNHNYFVYRVKLKYQYDSVNDIITNALPPQLLSLDLGVWYGDDPPYLTATNKGFSISADQQSVSYHMTLKGSFTLVVDGYPQAIVYRYQTTVYWTITI